MVDKKEKWGWWQMAELCLGTVQFGMEYGINNQIGRQPAWDESFEMLDYAIENGIDTIDTASAYGEAEMLLGEYLKENKKGQKVKVISKLRPNVIEDGKPVERTITEECKNSLKRISVEKLEGYLLHTPEYIYNEDVLCALQKLKQDGYVNNIGVSIYGLKEGYAAIDTGIVDYIQLPYSILDQRGIKEGFINAAKKAGITIFTRSAFLQGLFMMDKEDIPAHLQNAVPFLDIMENILDKYCVDKVSSILGFVNSEKDIDYLVFGVEKKEQLVEDIHKAAHSKVPIECIQELKERINNISENVVFPSLWSNGRKAE